MAILDKIKTIRDTLAIEKTGYDERNDYYYFKADDIAKGVRDKMVEVGVIHHSRILEHKVENIVDKQGRVRPNASGVVEITFVDVEDGSEFKTEALASGSDIGGDKATRKLAVQAFKIAAIDIFTVVEGMDKMDSDNYAEAPSLNDGAEEEKADGEPKLDSKAIGNQLTELINDPAHENITGESAMTLGRIVAKEILGEVPRDTVWKKDPRVLEELIRRLLAGEVG